MLGRTKLQKTRKVLGIPLPGKKIDLSDVTQHISEAGKQVGKLADEVRKASGEVKSVREKAEQIGRAFG